MSVCYICLSISELQQLLVDDGITVLVNRLHSPGVVLDENSSPTLVDPLLFFSPSFIVDDPAGALILEFTDSETLLVKDHHLLRTIPLRAVKRFIPFTVDARDVLSVTWSSLIKLSDPIFERSYQKYRLKIKTSSANRAGTQLVESFFKVESFDGLDPSKLLDFLPVALLRAEHRSAEEIISITGENLNAIEDNWVAECFGYTRRKSIKTQDALKPFADLGIILTNGPSGEVLNQLRDACRRLNESANLTLDRICSERDISSLSIQNRLALGETISIPVISLALFLRWKQAFHDNRSTLDSVMLAEDIQGLSGTVSAKAVLTALWLTGAYLGTEYVSPLYRQYSGAKYAALAENRRLDTHSKISPWNNLPDAIVVESKDACTSKHHNVEEADLSSSFEELDAALSAARANETRSSESEPSGDIGVDADISIDAAATKQLAKSSITPTETAVTNTPNPKTEEHSDGGRSQQNEEINSVKEYDLAATTVAEDEIVSEPEKGSTKPKTKKPAREKSKSKPKAGARKPEENCINSVLEDSDPKALATEEEPQGDMFSEGDK